MKLLSLLFLFLFYSCTDSGGGSGSSSDSKKEKTKEKKEYAFFQANLFGEKKLYMTSSLTEFPEEISEEVSHLIHLKNGYVFYVKENDSEEDTPYLYNYELKKEINLRDSFGISDSSDMKLSLYSHVKGESSNKSYSSLTFLCEKNLVHKVCSVNFYNNEYSVSLLDYEENEYVGTYQINNKPSVCYLDSRLRCHILDYNSFSDDVSYFLLNLPDPSASWDHVDLVYVLGDYFLVKGGTSSDTNYYLYANDYSYKHDLTTLSEKTFSLINSDDNSLLVLGNLDSEFKFWEVNYLNDSKQSVLEGDGIVSPSFGYLSLDTNYMYISMNTNVNGVELYKVDLSNWSTSMLTDSSGTDSTVIESYYKDYVVVSENSSRKVYKIENSLVELNLTYDDGSSLFIMGEFQKQYVFYGSSLTTDNTLFLLKNNELNEYSEIKGNYSDPEVSDVRL